MRFVQYFSSSDGNLYAVKNGKGRTLLLECGVRWARVQKAIDYSLIGIDGCLLTHEHKDHSKSLKYLLEAGVKVYSSRDTFAALGIERHHNMVQLHNGTMTNPFRAGEFEVGFWRANHDAVDPLIFVVRCDDPSEFLLFAPDTSYVTQRFKMAFDIIAIECSYDKRILQGRIDEGAISDPLAKRLLTSHAEKSAAMEYLSKCCDLSKCHEIHLLHMSRGNIDRERTRREFERKFLIETIISER
jgi:phosphoribosyl 1,2-cyclic phosphodiesterase